MKALWPDIVLCGIGWMAAGISVAADSLPLMAIACLALGLTGVIRIVRLILDRDRYWSLSNIAAGAMMPSYFLGAFITLVQYNPDLPEFPLPGGDQFLASALMAIIYLTLFYAVLVAMAPVENRFWQSTLQQLRSPAAWQGDATVRPAIGVALVGMVAAQLYLILTGGVTLGGADLTEDFQLPVGVALVTGFAPPMVAIAAWIIGRWQKPMGMTYLAVFVSVCQILWLGSMGRRTLLYGVVMFLSVFSWARGRRKSNRVFYIALPLLGVVYLATKIFVAMRYATYSYADAGTQSLTTLYSDAFSLLTTEGDLVAEQEKQNYASRFFILGHLILVMNGLTPSLAQFGKFLLIALFTCVPSLFLPGKTDLIAKLNWGGDGKALLNILLGLPQVDFPWTPMLAAYSDFMWLGLLLYPWLIPLMGWAFSRIIQSLRYPSFMIAGLGLCFTSFISTEVGMSDLVLTGRTLGLLWILTKMIGFFDRPGLS